VTGAPAPVDPETVAHAAAACPDVARLSEGVVGEVASYLPGRRVAGVRVDDEAVEVHIVARWGRPLPEVGEAVVAAVAPVAHGRPVRVFVDDLEEPAVVAG
jgi:uncharacterized alkaline shock family protein YloU